MLRVCPCFLCVHYLCVSVSVIGVRVHDKCTALYASVSCVYPHGMCVSITCWRGCGSMGCVHRDVCGRVHGCVYPSSVCLSVI